MSVIKACDFTPSELPVVTRARASSLARSCSRMNAPDPVLTSMTIASSPAAPFLEMIEATIKGIASMVAVASRREYSFLSAGAISAVWPFMAKPAASRTLRNSFSERSTRYPGIDSSLSSVPPVWPSPRPEIIGTQTPAAAASGAISRDVLSPTPPVECLSAFGLGISEKSRISPE